jgi:predicted MFS family arabinose efflux permease
LLPFSKLMEAIVQDAVTDRGEDAARAGARQVFGYIYFTLVSYLSVGEPLAVLPPYVHLRLGMSVAMAGLVIGLQSLATLASRPWVGWICDRQGAKVSVQWGMAACSASGAAMICAAAFQSNRWLGFAFLIASRLLLGMAVSLGSTGSTLWGIRGLGQEHTAGMISYNGIANYGGVGLGAPLGVVLGKHWGLAGIGVFTAVFGALSLAMASRKAPVPVVRGEPESFHRVLGRVAPYGSAVALSSVAYGVLTTFIALYFFYRRWNGAALCLTAFGAAFVAVRAFFSQSINRWGGFPVAIVSLAMTSVAVFLQWRAPSPWMAGAAAALTGFGFSLVYPALGFEAIRRVPEQNRGAALAGFGVFFDLSLFLTGPVAGVVIGWYGYASVFVFGLICVLAALGIVVVLRQMQKN